MKTHDNVCLAQIARRYNVHRATVSRAFKKFLACHKANKWDYRLGHEFLLNPDQVEEFLSFVTNGRKTQLSKRIKEEERDGT